MKRIVALGLLAFACVSAQPPATATKPAPAPKPATAPTWPKEPDGFNAAKFGMSEQEITVLFSVDRCYYNSSDDHYCKAKLNVDDRYWGLQFYFVDNHLVKISGDFAVDTYPDVRAGFLTKYGPPSGKWNSIVRTRVGVPYQQEELAWSGKKVEIFLSKYGDDVDSGWFLVTLKGLVDGKAAKRREAIKKALQ